MIIDAKTLESIDFIGNVLGTVFYYEPFSGESHDVYAALAELDPIEASKDWPFTDEKKALSALDLLYRGITEESRDDLLWEYRRLFVGPSAKAAPPWGSVYTDKDQVIFGRSTLELRKWMRETGVKKARSDGEPEDHIGLMLLMMSWLAGNDPENLSEFLEKHLLTWAPHFLEYMGDATNSDFFKGLSEITRASLDGIGDALDLEVERPRFYR